MEHLGFYYDPSRCIDCKACQMACKEKNKLSVGEFCRRADTLDVTLDGTRSYMRFSGACNHCTSPACTAVCPTGAMYVAEDGTVQHKDSLCIGCARCVHHCPYGAVSINKYTGYAQKCDACKDRRAEGREVACAEACPVRALHFGNLAELREKYGSDLGASLPFLPPEELTAPSLLVNGAKHKPPQGFSVPKTDFSSAPILLSEEGFHVVILGSGPAAVTAACELRRRSLNAQITVISRETHLPYSRPMLSKGLTGSFAMDRYPIVPENWLEEENVAFIGGVTITHLNTAEHTVTLSDGAVISYDKCIYALGADCFLPSIPGNTLAGVHTLRNAKDLHAIRCEMLSAEKVIIIGGGITGLEIAWELKKSGLAITVVEPMPHLLERFVDAYTAELLQETLTQAGIRILTGVGVEEIKGTQHVKSVSLFGGQDIPADLVLISTGYLPNISIAKNAGLATKRAVCVDEYLATSVPSVYACGDCTDRSAATWMQSIRQGKIAAANLLGSQERFTEETEPIMVHTADTSLLVVGDMGKHPGTCYQFLYGIETVSSDRFYINPPTPSRRTTHYAFSFAEGHLTGATLLGNLREMQWVEKAVAEGWAQETIRSDLRKRGVELNER